MQMQIFSNIPALFTKNALGVSESALQKSLRRLSSGLRINSAADDAAGLGISNKMQAQIRGLDQASRNAQDGISMIRTAEGGLNESQAILHRMRELSVQAGNDTLTSVDRRYIQEEIDQLTSELGRIASTTQFNRKKLLDGSSSALWSSSSPEVSAVIRGNLKGTDEIGREGESEGNFLIDITVTDRGLPEIQKTHTFGYLEKPALDTAKVVFVVDQTGSMAGMIDTVRENISSFVSRIKSQGVEDVRIGIATYYDNTFAARQFPGGDLWSGNETDVEILLNEIASGPLPGGTEDHYWAIDNAVAAYDSTYGENTIVGDRVFQSRYMVLITDEEGNAGTYGISENQAEIALLGTGPERAIEFTAVQHPATPVAGLISSTGGMPPLLYTDPNWGTDLSSTLGSKIGEQASIPDHPPLGDLDLSFIRQFFSPEGRFLLEEPQTVTLHQGDRSASVTIYSNDTLAGVAKKLNDAVADGLGQRRYAVNGLSSFASYVEGKDILPHSPQSVPGTIVLRSVVPGKDGRISLSGDEDILKALGLNTIQEAEESFRRASVTDAHSGKTVASGAVFTGSLLVGAVHPEVDISLNPMAGLSAVWSETQKTFRLESTGKYSAVLHLAAQSTVFQIGSNEQEDLGVLFGDMSAKGLGLLPPPPSVLNGELAAETLSRIDKAIDRVSLQRAHLGAYQNRLEHTILNLTAASSNLSSSESRIRDLDMAKEIMNFTRLNIMMQAGNSMLAQANQLPQSVLELMK